MKRSLLSLLALTAPLHAAGLVPSNVPAGAKWLLHLDLDSMRDSQTGKAVFAFAETRHGAQLQAMKQLSGIHLLKDLHDITFFGDGQPDHAVALISGAFDATRLTDVVKGADSYSGETHGGFTIHSWKDKDVVQHAAFATGSLLVFSRQNEALKQELDVLQAKGPATDAAPATPPAGGRPLFTANARLAEMQLPPDASKILRLASALQLSAAEDQGRIAFQLAADSKDTGHAKRLGRILDGVLALAEASSPGLVEADLQSEFTVSPDKPGVKISVSLPVSTWLGVMASAAASHKPAEAGGENERN